MLRTSLFVATIASLILVGSGAASATGGGAEVSSRVCGWYAISTCSRYRSAARRGAQAFGGYLYRTSEVVGFRPGFWCSAVGPQSKPSARAAMRHMQYRGAGSAYIKQGCER